MKKKFLSVFLTAFILACSLEKMAFSTSPESIRSQSEEEIIFVAPPSGWMSVDTKSLPTHVQFMVVGKGPSSFPPSLNLSWEPYPGTLKQYLKIVKNMNTAQGYEWKDLGTIQTQSGTGSLSQVDTKTQWGDVRLMHVILVKNGNVYIVTASALKNEFSLFYKEFFTAMRSLKIIQHLYEMISNPQEQNQLKLAVQKLQAQWQALLKEKQKENAQMEWTTLQNNVFQSEAFQNQIWLPFKKILEQKSQQLGKEGYALFLQKLEDQLFSVKP